MAPLRSGFILAVASRVDSERLEDGFMQHGQRLPHVSFDQLGQHHRVPSLTCPIDLQMMHVSLGEGLGRLEADVDEPA